MTRRAACARLWTDNNSPSTTSISRFHVLDVVWNSRASDAEADWTRRADARFPRGFNGFGTYGNPASRIARRSATRRF